MIIGFILQCDRCLDNALLLVEKFCVVCSLFSDNLISAYST